MNGRPFDKLRANGQVNLLTDFAQALASSPGLGQSNCLNQDLPDLVIFRIFPILSILVRSVRGPFVVSLSNHERTALRQAQGERRGQLADRLCTSPGVKSGSFGPQLKGVSFAGLETHSPLGVKLYPPQF